MMSIFKNEEHKKSYYATLELMKSSDCYRQAVAYLFTLDPICFEHIRDIYDFSENCIAPDGLDKAWQTGTSLRTTRLAFNLWNDWCTDGETYIGSDGYEEDLPSSAKVIKSDCIFELGCIFEIGRIFCIEAEKGKTLNFPYCFNIQ